MTAITNEQKKSKAFTTRGIVIIGLLSGLSYVLMLLESPPFLGFLRIEFSDIPAIIGGISFGPLAGVLIEFLKNLIKAITATKTAGIGELANFCISAAFVAPSVYLFRRLKGKYKPLIAFAAGTICMVIVGILINYFVTLPLYASLYGGMDNIVGAAKATIPAIKSAWTLIILGITPFNIVKGIMMSVVGYYTYRMLRKRLEGF